MDSFVCDVCHWCSQEKPTLATPLSWPAWALYEKGHLGFVSSLESSCIDFSQDGTFLYGNEAARWDPAAISAFQMHVHLTDAFLDDPTSISTLPKHTCSPPQQSLFLSCVPFW